jgi:hypothetical protein
MRVILNPNSQLKHGLQQPITPIGGSLARMNGVGGRLAQACPNYDSRDGIQPAAPPLAMRKGCAFPMLPFSTQPVFRRVKAQPSRGGKQ